MNFFFLLCSKEKKHPIINYIRLLFLQISSIHLFSLYFRDPPFSFLTSRTDTIRDDDGDEKDAFCTVFINRVTHTHIHLTEKIEK